MKVYVLRYYFAAHGEDFTRAVHMTHKGVLLDQCIYLLEVLLDMDWDDETMDEIRYVDSIMEKDNPITVDELIQHINVLERYAENIELYTEVEAFILQP
jgi:lysyl-tRNA synthetase class II